MALLVPDLGEIELLARMLNKNTPDDVVIHLFTDNVTIDEDSVIGDFTLDTRPNVDNFSLANANWTIAEVGNVVTATYTAVTWTYPATTASNVYGYLITNAAGTILLWGETFADGPYVVPAGGGTIQVTPKITLD